MSKIIKLGVCHNDKGSYSFDIYRINGSSKRILWSQSYQGLGHEFFMSFETGEQSREEYSNINLIEIIPLKGVGTRPAHPSELGELITSIAEHTKKDVFLHTKPKRLEEIK